MIETNHAAVIAAAVAEVYHFFHLILPKALAERCYIVTAHNQIALGRHKVGKRHHTVAQIEINGERVHRIAGIYMRTIRVHTAFGHMVLDKFGLRLVTFGI